MKYLNNAAFQVGGYNKKYSDNWDAIFGKKNAENTDASADEAITTEPSNTKDAANTTPSQ